MRYMMLIYTGKQKPRVLRRCRWSRRHIGPLWMRPRGGVYLRGTDPLEPTSTATTVRLKDGNVVVTDGPFAETKEQLAGYYILDCKDLDEALEWAARIPSSCGGAAGCVEVRPIHEVRKPAPEPKSSEYAKA